MALFKVTSGRNNQVKMVRHDNKFMQQILFLRSVLQHHFNKEPGNLLHMEEALFLKDIGSDKIGGFSCCPSMRNGQEVTSAAKAENLKQLTAGLKACSTPWNQENHRCACSTPRGMRGLESTSTFLNHEAM